MKAGYDGENGLVRGGDLQGCDVDLLTASGHCCFHFVCYDGLVWGIRVNWRVCNKNGVMKRLYSKPRWVFLESLGRLDR